MVIDFSATSEQHGVVEYYNVRGNSVRTYPLTKLEEWVIEKDLLNTGETEEITLSDTPFSKHHKIIDSPIYMDITDYLDLNWRSVTEDFYNAMNPTEFKSQNTPNQIVR